MKKWTKMRLGDGNMLVRIQKYLSQQNLLSRRKAEEYLQKGWIKVNGQVVSELGLKIDPEQDSIELAPEIQNIKQNYTTIAFHKPRGILTNQASPGEKEIRDFLPQELKHLNSIGRLDKDSEGLILLTDDGVFAKSILNTKQPHEREYLVTIDIVLTKDMQLKLENGVVILKTRTKSCQITRVSQKTFKIILTEGKNRQIRRMVNVVGANVLQLKRIRFGDIRLSAIQPGKYKVL